MDDQGLDVIKALQRALAHPVEEVDADVVIGASMFLWRDLNQPNENAKFKIKENNDLVWKPNSSIWCCIYELVYTKGKY